MFLLDVGFDVMVDYESLVFYGALDSDVQGRKKKAKLENHAELNI